MIRPTILIPAAGSSSRMRGRDKLLELVWGNPLLTHMARLAVAQADTIVTLRNPDPDRLAALQDLPVTLLHLDDAAEGMSASLRAVSHLETPLMILPADMPEITADDIAALISAHLAAPDLIHRGSSPGQPGHPVLFPRALVPELASLTGDQGARSVLDRHPDLVRLTDLPDDHALTDLDTPEDWARWRSHTLQDGR